MNKILKTISKYLLLLILFIPCFVKADMGAPMMTEYEVRVTNPKGTPALDGEGNEIGKFEYDEIINIKYEKIINDELYGQMWDEETSTYKNVKLSDTKLVTDVIDLEKFKQPRKGRYYVFDDTNVLYKGPSKTYGKVEPETKLKKGTIIEIEYYDDVWGYVEQDGVKGWVYKYTYKNYGPYEEQPGLTQIAKDVYSENERLSRTTLNEMKLYNSPKEKEVIGTIPKGTEVEIKYVYNHKPKLSWYYVSFNGKEGWIETNFIEVEGIYYYDMLFNPNDTYTVNNKDGVSMYKEYNSTSEVLETIPNNTTLNVKYELVGYGDGWYQIEYNGKTGWVNGNDVNGYIEETDPQPEGPTDEAEPEINTPDTEDTTTTGEEKEKLSPKEIIIICISMALVASLTAFVTIKLINKKKEQQI